MKDAEDYRFCLDCFETNFAEIEARDGWDKPDSQEGSNVRKDLEIRAQTLLKGKRYKCVVLYGEGPDGEWRELDYWPQRKD